MKPEYGAQYIDSNFTKHEVFSVSINSLKKKLSKLDVVGSAAIWKKDDKNFKVTYYKPHWRKKAFKLKNKSWKTTGKISRKS